ncbi:MAG: hypothetical protein OEN00_14785 [Gemmatimonadota bacterium]|nr:hypothetical protein [Gemmatimonadota bacterium]
MKVIVQRNELKATTMVCFEIPDDEISAAEDKTARHGWLRPPRIESHGNFRNLLAKDWIQYVAWLAKTELTF